MPTKTAKRVTAKRSYASSRKSNSPLISRAFNFKSPLGLSVVVLFVIVGGLLIYRSFAGVSPYDTLAQSSLKSQPTRGLVYNGLRKVKSDAHHKCAGMFEITGATDPNDGKPMCTHGPDPAPIGVDMTKPNLPALAAQQAAVAREKEVTTDVMPASAKGGVVAAYDGFQSQYNPWSPMPLQCYGDGSDSYRYHFIYAYTAQTGNRFAKLYPYFNNVVKKVEHEVVHSAMDSGPGSNMRHLRVHLLKDSRGNCTGQTDISQVYIPGFRASTSFSDPSDLEFNQILREVKKQWKSKDRKYVVWLDNFDATTCGIGTGTDGNKEDIDPYKNPVTTRADYSMIGHSCWNVAEGHEMMHNLGAVGKYAPYTSGAGHCWLLYDAMCYADGEGFKAANGHETVLDSTKCYNPTIDLGHQAFFSIHQYVFDCYHQIYFDTRTHSARSHYLRYHYDVADSPYMGR